MRIAITGANGFIGRNLYPVLSGAVGTISISDCVTSGSPACAVVDLRNLEQLREWLVPIAPEVIVHLGARTDLLGKTLADYDANIGGVKNLIEVARELPSLRRVIFASSRMVCRIDDIPANYEHYSPPNAYGASKAEGERIVKNANLPFEWVIVRPTSIWGPGFGIPYRNFFDQVRNRRYFHQSGHNPKKSFGYVGNTVWQLCKLIEAPSVIVNRRTFYLGDYEPLSVREWADHIHASFGLPGRIPTVPMPLLRMGAKAGDLVNALLKRDRAPLTTFRLNNLITDMVYPQLAELHTVTGALPYDWRAGTDKTVEWLKNS